MHEYSLTQTLINDILTNSSFFDNKSDKTVTLGIGVFSHEKFENIQFWWNQLIIGTKLEGWILIKQDIPGKLFCAKCKKDYDVIQSYSSSVSDIIDSIACPSCNSLKTEVLDGLEIKILEPNSIIH